jgi:hypothetical protein
LLEDDLSLMSLLRAGVDGWEGGNIPC